MIYGFVALKEVKRKETTGSQGGEGVDGTVRGRTRLLVVTRTLLSKPLDEKITVQ